MERVGVLEQQWTTGAGPLSLNPYKGIARFLHIVLLTIAAFGIALLLSSGRLWHGYNLFLGWGWHCNDVSGVHCPGDEPAPVQLTLRGSN